VFFKYDGNTKKWSFKFSHSKSPLGAASNSNHNNNFNEYDVFAADLLTKIHNIKQYVHGKYLNSLKVYYLFRVSTQLSLWPLYCYSCR
jgi:hypothetical protein